MVLYNDRVYAWHRMAKLDKVIDEDPSLMNISQMVKDDIRNRLAFLELEHYNKHHKFLYKHPILKDYKLHNDLDRLRKASPERFMNELVNADKNITRYESRIRNRKYRDEEEKQTWLNHIEDFKQKLEIMKKLIAK